jgi:glyoxylase-like metal-dependent hydrolase (beta-lactamase superfamily II)
MIKTIRRVALVLVLGIALALIWGYRRATELAVEKVTEDVHVITGLGGNLGVLTTDRGAVVVDTMTFRTQGAHILELAEELGHGPVQMIVNTHYHRDHTPGNLVRSRTARP